VNNLLDIVRDLCPVDEVLITFGSAQVLFVASMSTSVSVREHDLYSTSAQVLFVASMSTGVQSYSENGFWIE